MKKNKGTYEVWVECFNCFHREKLTIKKGVRWDTYVKGKTCSDCGIKDSERVSNWIIVKNRERVDRV